MYIVMLLVIGFFGGGLIALNNLTDNSITDEQYREIRYNMKRK